MASIRCFLFFANSKDPFIFEKDNTSLDDVREFLIKAMRNHKIYDLILTSKEVYSINFSRVLYFKIEVISCKEICAS